MRKIIKINTYGEKSRFSFTYITLLFALQQRGGFIINKCTTTTRCPESLPEPHRQCCPGRRATVWQPASPAARCTDCFQSGPKTGGNCSICCDWLRKLHRAFYDVSYGSSAHEARLTRRTLPLDRRREITTIAIPLQVKRTEKLYTLLKYAAIVRCLE